MHRKQLGILVVLVVIAFLVGFFFLFNDRKTTFKVSEPVTPKPLPKAPQKQILETSFMPKYFHCPLHSMLNKTDCQTKKFDFGKNYIINITKTDVKFCKLHRPVYGLPALHCYSGFGYEWCPGRIKCSKHDSYPNNFKYDMDVEFTNTQGQFPGTNVLIYDNGHNGREHVFKRTPELLVTSLSMESKGFYPMYKQPWYNKFFNVTFGYRDDLFTYLSHYIAPYPSLYYNTPVPYEQKDPAIFFMTGSCLLKEDYAKAFQKYLPIASYGLCLNNRKFPYNSGKFGPDSLYKKKLVQRNHRFTLAIENRFDDEYYFTEKLFDSLEAGSVPIYKGSSNYTSFFKNTFEGGVIWADDFKDMKSLAEYVSKVDKDKKLYESYLEWKKKPISKEMIQMLSRSIGNTACRACDVYWKIKDKKEELITIFICSKKVAK
eukprot:gene6983-11149_t